MKTNPFKHAMTWGLVLGVAFSFNFILSSSSSTWLGLLSYLVIAGILYLTYRFTCHYRNTECDGAITYGQGLSYIILLYFFASIISSIFKYVYFQFINPEYLTNIYDQTMLVMEQLKMPITDELASDMESVLKPATFSLQYIWINTMLGVFVGLVMAVVTKKEKNLFEE